MSHYCYIVRCSDETLYTGYCRDVTRRVSEHNSDTVGAKYTRGRQPVILVYFEEFKSRSAAQKREAEIKKLSRGAKLDLIKNERPTD